MGKLSYSGIMSLDGYIADRDGKFDWSAPDEEVHAFVNEREHGVGTYLFGRRMFEVMSAWETMPTADEPPVVADFAAHWFATEKVVYSTTLETVSTARTRLQRFFDADRVRELTSASTKDVSIGGAELASHALRAGLVDELQLYLVPTVVGGGTSFLPGDLRLDLELLEQHRFSAGTVFIRYAVRKTALQRVT